MKAAMQYQNKTPEEIVRQYKKKLRAKQGLLILIFLLYVIVGIRGIWWGDDGTADVLLKLLTLFVITYPISIWISRDFMLLNLILSQDCDPVTYVQVMRLLEKVYKRKWSIRAIHINEVAGLMWSGQFTDALALAESLCNDKVSAIYQLVLLNTRFSCYKKMKDLERAMQVRQEADALISSSTKASVQKTGQKMLKVMDVSLALWRGEYETFRRMEEARSAGYTAKLQKVVSAVCLADVDIACNELKNARTHLEYAIREGRTLYVVEDARRMLAELAQKERVEGTGHGDGKYAGLLERAKNANFDCACGYDPDGQMEDDFGTNSLLDCIYLCREMKYRDVMGSLVDEWKKTITEWSDSNRRVLIDFNTFLERNAENEKLYQEQLAEVLPAEKSSTRDIISGYKNLIRYYIYICDYEKALCLCEKVIKTTDYGQIRTLRLFKDILEACFEVTANHSKAAAGLWKWARTELQKVQQSSWYGNLYIKGIAAAKAMNDPYGKQLEQEYENFLASFRR